MYSLVKILLTKKLLGAMPAFCKFLFLAMQKYDIGELYGWISIVLANNVIRVKFTPVCLDRITFSSNNDLWMAL